MGILALPPSGIITDNDGIVIGRSSDGKGYLLTGGTEGQVPVIQGDGTIAYGAAGASSLSELDDWAANTLTVPGALTVRQAGGVAGTDEVQIYHDGTDAHIDTQSGDLIFNNSNAKVNSSGEFTNNAGFSGQERFGAANNGGGVISTSLGYNTRVANGTVAVGYNTNGHNGSVVLGRDAGGGFQNTVAIGAYATGRGVITAQVSAIAIGTGGSTATSVRVHAAAGECVIGGNGGISNFYLGGYGAEYGLTDVTLAPGGRTGTDLDGFDLILAGGKPTGAGTPGQVQFQVAPSGASGTTLGTLTTVGLFDEQGLTVRQAGGVAGTDEIQIYHDGTNAYIDAQSGDLIFNNSNAKVNSSGEFTNNAGFSGQERFGAANNGGGVISTSLGYNTRVADGTVAVGYNTNGHNGSVVLGRDAGGGFQNTVAIGAYATGSGVIYASESAIAIGTGGSTQTSVRVHAAAGECVIGGRGGISNFYLGGYGAEYGLTNVTLAPGGRTGTDLDGFDLILAGGKGTGTGVGGSVIVQAAPVGLTGTSLNSLVDVAEFDADTTAGNTRFLIYDVDNGQLERVSVGAADSGGAGYKLLRIAN